jgi:hypothetical protein
MQHALRSDLERFVDRPVFRPSRTFGRSAMRQPAILRLRSAMFVAFFPRASISKASPAKRTARSISTTKTGLLDRKVVGNHIE